MGIKGKPVAFRKKVGVCLPHSGNRFAFAFIKLHLWLQKAHAIPLRPSKKNINIQQLDALILSGGDDIDPSIYGGDKYAHNTKLDPKRDKFELEMLQKAYEQKLPILGICRGAQLINIFFKGNLYATILDLDEFLIHQNSVFPIKQVEVEKDSKLHAIVQDDAIVANSIHNQAINKVGVELKISAKHEKIIEAIEMPNYPFLLGVQWHPEYLIYFRKQRAIFKALLDSI
jgi:putative glutamine amidotransferase